MAIAQISPVILPSSTASKATEAGIAKAEELGIPYTVTVLDGSGNLVQASRMDGAAIASIDTSHAKARTAVFFATPTAELAGAVRDNGPLATVETSTEQKLAFVSGAVPIADSDGVVIGAVGAGGGTPDQDNEVAQAAVDAL